MVGVGRRMNKLKELLDVRHGPGAAVLPSGITRIHLEFAFPFKTTSGHYGPRKFWRSCLPRLKYWNPSVPMIVNQTAKEGEALPATLRIYFRQAASSSPPPSAPPPDAAAAASSLPLRSSTTGESPAPPPGPDERVVALDIKAQQPDRILDELLSKTGAVPVLPTPEEEFEMREVAERRERALVDREVMRRHLERERREASLMAQARSEAASLKEALD